MQKTNFTYSKNKKVQFYKINSKSWKMVLTKEWNPCIVVIVVETVKCCWDGLTKKLKIIVDIWLTTWYINKVADWVIDQEKLKIN